MTNEQLVIQIQAGANVADNMLRLWQQNRCFIFKMANKYRGQAEEDDLVQEGYLGLCRAVDGYDPAQGIDFLPYAANWIRQKMVRFIHNNGTVRITVHEQSRLYQYRKLSNVFMMETGREPTNREIGHYLGLSYKVVCRLKRVAQMADIRSLDTPIDGDVDTALSDTVAAPGDIEMDTLDKVQVEQLKAVIWPLVDALPESQPQVLRARYQDGRTLKDIAADLGCSYQRAAQICREGLRTLRRPGQARYLKPFLADYIDTHAYRGSTAVLTVPGQAPRNIQPWD